MLPFLTEHWGNPSSAYHFGQALVRHIDAAREKVAALLNAEPRELVFTSCGTESNNAAIHSALALQPQKRHVIFSAVEHSANMSYGEYLKRQGYEVTFLPVDSEGLLDMTAVENAIRPETAIVSVMYANNETGVVYPVAELARLCHTKGTLFHTDAVQAPGKLPINVREIGADYLSLSAHKLHAPKGIGLLYVKQRTRFQPYLMGGHQERGQRGGTENVAGIVAFGRAAELALANLTEENTRVRALRDRLENTILETISHAARNGPQEPRLPNTSNIAFGSIEAEALLMMFDLQGICASSGSACTTGSLEPSHVLTAMGVSRDRARSSIRFSLGIDNTDADVDYLLQHLPEMIRKLRVASIVSMKPIAFMPMKGPNRAGRSPR